MADTEHRRPSPEQLLQQVEDEQRRATRGRLKIFLGYASGVGKSFRMFDEGRRRRERGEDVVVAAVQPEMSNDVAKVAAQLEMIASRSADNVPVIDVETILRRRPQVFLVDNLA